MLNVKHNQLAVCSLKHQILQPFKLLSFSECSGNLGLEWNV